MKRHILSNKRAVICSALLALTTFGLGGCSNDSTVGNGGGGIYANPDTVSFSQEHLAVMARRAYLDLSYSSPLVGELEAVRSAGSYEEAKPLYDALIDNLLDSGAMKDRMTDYFTSSLGVGDRNSGPVEERYPANLGVYVLLSGLPMTEMILADYAVDDDLNVVPQDYTDGPPIDVQAGYITMEAFVNKYITKRTFDMVRESIGFNLNGKTPYDPSLGIIQWSKEVINTTYDFDPGDPNLDCYSCHSSLDAIRYAFRFFEEDGDYNDTLARNNDQYGHEDNVGDGSTLEPRDPTTGDPMDEVTALDFYKLTESGVTVDSPKVLAQEIAAHPAYPKAMTERLLSIMLDLDQGQPGTSLRVPDHFSANEAQVAFLEEWTTTFKDKDMVALEFMRTFLKSADYLIASYDG